VARRAIVRVSRGRTQRRPVGWSGSVAVALTLVPAATKVLLLTLAPTAGRGETVRRIRGTVYTKAGEAASYHGAIGAFVANSRAVTAGVASLLDPVTDVGDDAWFWYQSFHGGGTATPGSAGDQGGQVWEIDSKAMRRVDDGFEIVFVVANATAATDFSVALSLRALSSEAS